MEVGFAVAVGGGAALGTGFAVAGPRPAVEDTFGEAEAEGVGAATEDEPRATAALATGDVVGST